MVRPPWASLPWPAPWVRCLWWRWRTFPAPGCSWSGTADTDARCCCRHPPCTWSVKRFKSMFDSFWVKFRLLWNGFLLWCWWAISYFLDVKILGWNLNNFTSKPPTDLALSYLTRNWLLLLFRATKRDWNKIIITKVCLKAEKES